jgi:hypothetical protein
MILTPSGSYRWMRSNKRGGTFGAHLNDSRSRLPEVHTKPGTHSCQEVTYVLCLPLAWYFFTPKLGLDQMDRTATLNSPLLWKCSMARWAVESSMATQSGRGCRCTLPCSVFWLATLCRCSCRIFLQESQKLVENNVL